MEAEAPWSFTKSVPTNQKISRRRPLLTCGVSFIAVGQIAFSKSQGLNGWIGSIMRSAAALARPFTPLASIMQYLFLAELSFIDKFIVATEKMIEFLFPPSTHVFNKIDELICVVEALPNLFKDAENKFPMIIHQSPLLEYFLVHLISWLKVLLSSLTSENAKEKGITVDVSYGEMHEDFASVDDLHGFVESPVRAKSGTLKKIPLLSPKLDDSKQGYEFAVEEETQEKVAETGTEEKDVTEEVVAWKGTEEENDTEKGTEETEVAVKGTQETEVAEKETQEEREVAEKGTQRTEVAVKETQVTEVAEKGALEKGTEEKEAVEKGSEEKEVTKTGTDEKLDNSEGSAVEEETAEIKKVVAVVEAGKLEVKKERSNVTEDSILDLFESTWHSRPPKKR